MVSTEYKAGIADISTILTCHNGNLHSYPFNPMAKKYSTFYFFVVLILLW